MLQSSGQIMVAGAAITDRNRRNAQKSTGPRTDIGKLSSSRNAYKHGVSSYACDRDSHEYQEVAAFLAGDSINLSDYEYLVPAVLYFERVQCYMRDIWVRHSASIAENGLISSLVECVSRDVLYCSHGSAASSMSSEAIAVFLELRRDWAGNDFEENRRARDCARVKLYGVRASRRLLASFRCVLDKVKI